jgi:hypothetical protein
MNWSKYPRTIFAIALVTLTAAFIFQSKLEIFEYTGEIIDKEIETSIIGEDDIVFAIWTGRGYHVRKSLAIKNTWMREISNGYFFRYFHLLE